jgi:hypothetical protein
MYFGKTTKDPLKYSGSGKYWLRHLKVHGKDVDTFVVLSSEDEKFCSEYASLFSKVHQIVESPAWANLMEEQVVGGLAPGFIFSEEQRAAVAASSKAMWADPVKSARVRAGQLAAQTPEHRQKKSENSTKAWTPERKLKHAARIRQLRAEGRYDGASTRGVPKSEDHRRKISESLKGRKE